MAHALEPCPSNMAQPSAPIPATHLTNLPSPLPFLASVSTTTPKSQSVSCLVVSDCEPMDHRPSGFCVHGILQARILEWVAPLQESEVFPIQGSNLRCRHILYHPSHQGSPTTTPTTWESNFCSTSFYPITTWSPALVVYLLSISQATPFFLFSY